MYIKRMKDLREEANLTQKKFSEILHVSPRTYSHYEKGDRNISVELLIRVAEYYRVSMDYLTGRTNRKKINK